MIAEIILSTVAIFAIRHHWMIKNIALLAVNVNYWTVKTNQDEETKREISELWPTSHVMFELWHWNFRRYVVRPGIYDEMMNFIKTELTKKDITILDFAPPIKDKKDESTQPNGSS